MWRGRGSNGNTHTKTAHCTNLLVLLYVASPDLYQMLWDCGESCKVSFTVNEQRGTQRVSGSLIDGSVILVSRQLVL